MKIQREMVVTSLEQMCDLMCGGVEEDFEEEYDEYADDRTETLIGGTVQVSPRE